MLMPPMQRFWLKPTTSIRQNCPPASVSQTLAKHACCRLSVVAWSTFVCHACFLQIVTGLEHFLRLVDPSASSSQVPAAVACSKDSRGDGGEGPLFQQRCAWPGQSPLDELGSLEGLLQAAFRGQKGTENRGVPARSGCMHYTSLRLGPPCKIIKGGQ